MNHPLTSRTVSVDKITNHFLRKSYSHHQQALKSIYNRKDKLYADNEEEQNRQLNRIKGNKTAYSSCKKMIHQKEKNDNIALMTHILEIRTRKPAEFNFVSMHTNREKEKQKEEISKQNKILFLKLADEKVKQSEAKKALKLEFEEYERQRQRLRKLADVQPKHKESAAKQQLKRSKSTKAKKSKQQQLPEAKTTTQKNSFEPTVAPNKTLQ